MFDSSYARESEYVRDEIDIWQNNKGIKIAVCLAEADGEWRKNEVFSGQNTLTYCDFNSYETGIRELCTFLDITYRPKFIEPRDLDFDEEIRRHAEHFKPLERQAILDAYAYFRKMHATRPETAAAQLIVIIERYLSDRPVRIISPYLALAVLQSEQGQPSAAKQTYRAIVDSWPEDPRGWAGLAGTLYELERYRDAAEALKHCIDRIRHSGEPDHERHLDEIIWKLASTYRAAGLHELALAELGNLSRGSSTSIEATVLSGLLSLDLGRIGDATDLLSQAYDVVLTHDNSDPECLLELVDGLRRLGATPHAEELIRHGARCHPEHPDVLRCMAVSLVESDQLESALAWYEDAIRYHPNSIRCLTEAAMLSKHLGADNRCAKFIETALSRTARNGGEEYFVGLAHYLGGRTESAMFHWRRAQDDPISQDWPFYDAL